MPKIKLASSSAYSAPRTPRYLMTVGCNEANIHDSAIVEYNVRTILITRLIPVNIRRVLKYAPGCFEVIIIIIIFNLQTNKRNKI